MEEVAKREEFNVFSLFDRLDDDLIIQELEGRLPEVLTYHFSDKGKEIWGLSKSGVDESTNELAKKGEVIRELDLNYTLTEDEGFFICKAGRFAISKDGKEILLDTKTGTKRQPRKYDNGKENPFWFEQGSIKACRNAAMRLIPAAIKQGVIEYAKQKGKVKTIVGPKPQEPSGSTGKTKEDFPSIMAREKERIGEEKFFEILGDMGYESIEMLSQATRDEQIKVYKSISAIK